MKVLFFAHDPGGANAIAPIISLMEKRHDVHVYAKGAALNILSNAQALPQYFNENIDHVSKHLGCFLQNLRPDIIITGTSAHDFTEKFMWKVAADFGIKSIAILDHWVNYGIRFSRWTVAQKEHFCGICDFLPSNIIVMDEFAKNEMINDGVPEVKVLPFGNPHFETMRKSIPRRDKSTSTVKCITFASEPLLEDYGQGGEIEIAQSLALYIQNKNVKCIIRLHPREHVSKYAFLASDKVILDQSTPAAELIFDSDVVVSQSSMFLIEAAIQSKPCISYQPHAKDKNGFILTKNGSLPFIQSETMFFDELESILEKKKTFNFSMYVKTDVSKSIVEFIEDKLCQN